MSSRLWEFFLRDDVDSFRWFLATASYTSGGQRSSGPAPGFRLGSPGSTLASPGGASSKSKKLSGTSPGTLLPDRGSTPKAGRILSREDLNARDHHGTTLLHHVASSPKLTATEFAISLLEIPLVDIYAQDWESGWTALHRALYAGNAAIAQALLAREMRDVTDFTKSGSATSSGGSLIKIKDREGYSPFDLYGATIASRDIKRIASQDSALDDLDTTDAVSIASSHAEDYDEDGHFARTIIKPRTNVLGDEVFTFGSNKNLNLGVGDQDDRQFPERIALKRPDHLLQRFFREFQERQLDESGLDAPEMEFSDLPALVKHKTLKIQDIAMSKLHTAILTTDPESNLFLCGFGPGGRLGTGDESTRFSFVCVDNGGLSNKKVVSVALGQDHTLAITENGEIFSWGSNKYGQLGYGLPRTNNRDDVPMQKVPRQIFNPFKKEVILGAAASAVHSVVFSNSGLYTFGKNEGQLGLVDSDARSLETQTTPRRVGASLFSASIQTVSAIDNATAILLQNHEVWVFSQYGYSRLSFPLDISSSFIRDSFMATRYDTSVNRIVKIKSGGGMICALSSFGEVFTVQVNRTENPPTSTSTTNPAKIRNSLSMPIRVWSVKKAHMAVKDVDVGQDGSIIICTASGSAWTKEKRGKSKESGSKDHKFARVPGLSRVVGVCSNAFGAYAVAQRNCDVTKEQINVDISTLWSDLLPLSPFNSIVPASSSADVHDDVLYWEPIVTIKKAVMSASDVESYFRPLQFEGTPGTVWIMSTTSELRIPVHEFILAGRSPVLRKAFHDLRHAHSFSIPDILTISYDSRGQAQLQFQAVDFLTILNLAFFVYTDNVFDMWQLARHTPESASRYRQVRTEVMRIASCLGLSTLERSARLMIEPTKALKDDMELAIKDTTFFDSGDVVIELSNDMLRVHSQVVCQRCPFFDALFRGRSGGRWLASRRTDPTDDIYVDLKHIDRHIFEFVLRYLYADTEEQLFDQVRTKDLDDLIDLVLDVAFVANELMIDRLGQICQKMLGRFVTTRNVCHLLNSIAPCCVKEFREAALEYICLNLEDLLANRLLAELDENLLGALDMVCHENQLSSFPVSRGRNTEDYILEKYPELVSSIERERRRKIDSMRLRSHLGYFETNEVRLRATSAEKTPTTPSAQKSRATSIKDLSTAMHNQALKSKHSTGDLMFQMDEEPFLASEDQHKGKAAIRSPRPIDTGDTRSYPDSPALCSSLAEGASSYGRSFLDDQMAYPQEVSLAESPTELRAAALQGKQFGSSTPPSATEKPWSASVVSGSKKNLKDIMSEATQSRVSNLSLGMSARKENNNNTPKLSQKERKKIQQQQMQEMLVAQQKAKETPQNPWKMPAPSKTPTKPTLGVVNDEEPQPPDSVKSTKSPMTLRQTVAGTPPPRSKEPQPIQAQNNSNAQTPSRPSISGPSLGTSPTPQAQSAVKSVRHIPRPEPYQTSFHSPSPNSLSLAAILMQQQTEKNELHEAATAKHNLQDIQQEQEFQEWWDKESRRIQGLPEPGVPEPSEGKDKGGRASRGGRGNGQSQGKRRGGGKGGNKPGPTSTSQPSRNGPETPKKTSTPRRENQRPPRSGHTDANTGNNSRRGGRGGGRGRGKDRDRQ
ncbi:BTB domain and ankyrin repeat protein [Aspergillus avenaceus]|uniref:BTB domain and ankyrin repeat protein n=1 Tax=Aspergillus avenaceus TaxID=36643 RepID=A0A5N6TMQ0_ASPAV|nr:BTB domain and ankyrin repeat protein [Aspergillus avenaceus]